MSQFLRCLQCWHSGHRDVLRLMLCFHGFHLASPILSTVSMLTCSIPGPLKHHPVRSMSTQPTLWALASVFPPSLSLDLKVSKGSPCLNRLLIYILWSHFLHSHKEFLPVHLFPQDALRMLAYFQKVSHFYGIKYIPWAQHLRLSKVSLCLRIFFFPLTPDYTGLLYSETF